MPRAHRADTASSPSVDLPLVVGPFSYALAGADEWGVGAVTAIGSHVQSVASGREPDREVLYAGLVFDPATRRASDQGRLPRALSVLRDQDLPPSGWHVAKQETGCLSWLHDDTPTALMTPAPHSPRWPDPYHFPWHALVADCMTRRHVVVHAALAGHGGRGFLLTAPPGGGKSTTVTALPDGWSLLGDDGCLLWEEDGGFHASPLPTWSQGLGVNAMPEGLAFWRTAAALPAAGAVVLEKAQTDRARPLEPLTAVSSLYRALSEHPVMLGAREDMRGLLLDVACRLAEHVPCWGLEVTLAKHGFADELRRIADAGLR